MANDSAEWLFERGIGEDRAILIENDRVIAAKCRWPGELSAGLAIDVKLVRKNGSRGFGETTDGRGVMLDRLPRDASEGEMRQVIVTRGPIAERGRYKLASARPPEAVSAAGFDPFVSGKEVRRFATGLWEEIWTSASQGTIAFPGGSLLFSATPAMTLVDIDGDLAPRQLALAAVGEIATALRQFDLGGSIGIDFPTLQAKEDRKAVDAALDLALAEWPHERTAMNGFGFVQLVARLEGPSLLHRFSSSRVGMCARLAMRVGEQAEGAGRALLLTVHPALNAKLKEEWIAELARRTGKEVRIASDPCLALEAPQAQIVSL